MKDWKEINNFYNMNEDIDKELYQISVVGECDYVSDVFNAHSKKSIYTLSYQEGD